MAVTLADFLLARIDEDEAVACMQIERLGPATGAAILGVHLNSRWHPVCDPTKVLAECEAKRRIVQLHVGEAPYVYKDKPEGTLACDECGDVVTVAWPCSTLRALAPPYATHPDFREEW